MQNKKCKRKLMHSACQQKKFPATRTGGNCIQISSLVYDRFGTNGLMAVLRRLFGVSDLGQTGFIILKDRT